MKASVGDATEEKWTFGIYDRANIRGVESELAPLGQSLLYALEGMVFAIPQFDKLGEIVGEEICFDSGQLVFQNYTD